MTAGPVALVIGGSQNVWKDLDRALALTMGRDRILVATNFAGRVFKGEIDAWATLHPESLAGWRAEREVIGLNTDYRAFVHEPRRNSSGAEVWQLAWSGSSGLFGAQVAVQAMGASGAILCGVPIDVDSGHFAEPGPWALAEKYRPAFLAAKAADFPMRSMSGWTQDLLGRPDLEWLDELGVGPARPRARKAPEATMRIKMLKTRNWTPPEDRRQTTKYLADTEYTVKRAWGEALVRDRDAVEILEPRQRDPLDHDDNGRKGGVRKAAGGSRA